MKYNFKFNIQLEYENVNSDSEKEAIEYIKKFIDETHQFNVDNKYPVAIFGPCGESIIEKSHVEIINTK
jgi:hypothetical protein